MTKTYTFCEDSVSDLHKDVYGCRPGVSFWARWNSASDEDKQSEWEWLVAALETAMAEDRRREERAIEAFEALVAKTMSFGASDRETAIRWIMDGTEHVNGDWEYFEFLHGLPFGYFKRSA